MLIDQTLLKGIIWRQMSIIYLIYGKLRIQMVQRKTAIVERISYLISLCLGASVLTVDGKLIHKIQYSIEVNEMYFFLTQGHKVWNTFVPIRRTNY